jgi:hypothetical protein
VLEIEEFRDKLRKRYGPEEKTGEEAKDRPHNLVRKLGFVSYIGCRRSVPGIEASYGVDEGQ